MNFFGFPVHINKNYVLHYTVAYSVCNSICLKKKCAYPNLKTLYGLKNANHHLSLQQVVLFLLVKVKVTQLWMIFCDSMDYSLPDSIYGILLARILECIALPFSRGYFWPRGSKILWELPKGDTEILSEQMVLEKWLQQTCLMRHSHKPSLYKNHIVCRTHKSESH